MSPNSPVIYLGLGSNLGERARQLARAALGLALLPGVDLLRLSPVYRTAPWGVTEQPDFLNMVLSARTLLPPEELLKAAKGLEVALGRVPGPKWGPRAIDVDILLYSDRHEALPSLNIPHPRIAERQFVLVPLADLAPSVVVADCRTAADLARPDGGEIERIGSLRAAIEWEQALSSPVDTRRR